MKILIMDDEELAINRLQRILEELNYEYESATTLEEFKTLEQNHSFDIYLLDINMPEVSGIELAKEILATKKDAFVIFQTAYEEYAIKAYQLGAIDYLLKPYSKDDLQKSITRALSYKKQENRSITFLTKNGDESYLIRPEEIVYVQADLNEVIIRTAEGFSYYSKKISEMDSYLQGDNFFRIHRSYIVNTNYIKNMKTVEQSKIEFYFTNIKDSITSSKDGAKKFREYIEKSV